MIINKSLNTRWSYRMSISVGVQKSNQNQILFSDFDDFSLPNDDLEDERVRNGGRNEGIEGC